MTAVAPIKGAPAYNRLYAGAPFFLPYLKYRTPLSKSFWSFSNGTF